MGAMIDTDGGNASDKQSGQRCGAACCRKVRRSPPRRANGGKLVCACLFLPRGSSERPRFFCLRKPPDGLDWERLMPISKNKDFPFFGEADAKGD